MAEFEPVELCLEKGGLTARRIRGRSEANAKGRDVLRELVRQAIDGCGNCPQPASNGQVVDEVDVPTLWTGTIIEVGTWAGGGVLEMIEGLHGYSNWRIFAIDTWEGSEGDATAQIAKIVSPKRLMQIFCKNMGDLLFRRVFPLHGRSLTYASLWPHPVAMVYLDDNHAREAVKSSINAWWPHVLPGGFLAGHDFELFPGVKQAVLECFCPGEAAQVTGGDGFAGPEKTYAGAHGLNVHVEGEVWYVQKPHAEVEPKRISV